MHHTSEQMRSCIAACQNCEEVCLSTAMSHCLETGGKHTEPEHFRLMIACAEICSASARVMLTGSSVHAYVCEACARVCEACAESCESVGDMQACVDACRACAESCRQMSA